MEDKRKIRAVFAFAGSAILAVSAVFVYLSEGKLGALFDCIAVGTIPCFGVGLVFPGLYTESQLREQRGRRRLALALSGAALLSILAGLLIVLSNG